ncbi:MAG: ankyrin repeat domain-containing protein [Planctomycetes bacterium]|nr:ankyrin repeat domain-containing protein [Planctomycetota bacterium]
MASYKNTDEEAIAQFLHYLENNDVTGIDKALSKGISPNVDIGDGWTPLMLASFNGYLEAAKILIKHGVDVNLQNSKNETALSLTAAVVCNPEDETDQNEEDKDSRYWQVVFEGKHVQIIRLLLQSCANADTQNNFINEFFMLCCSEGFFGFVRALLDNGADVNAKGSIGMTPLMHAILSPSQPEVFKLLLGRGGDVDLRNDLDLTVLDQALGDATLDLAKLIVDAGGNINEENYYLTRAAEEGQIEVVKFLLENGADPHKKNDRGETALKLARQNGHSEIVTLLREAVGLPKLNLNKTQAESFAEEQSSCEKTKGGSVISFLQNFFHSHQEKNFYRDGKEIFLRSWWLAYKLYISTANIFSITAPSSFFDDERIVEQDRKIFIETIAYIMSFVLDKLAAEIKEAHNWESKGGYDLNITYQVNLGMALDQVFGLTEKGDELFVELLQSYWTPDYDDDYEDYWGICDEPIDMNKTLGEIINVPISEEEYNAERLYTYRLSKIVNIVDHQKVIENIRNMYQNIGLSYYNGAFFQYRLGRIKKELKQMANKEK